MEGGQESAEREGRVLALSRNRAEKRSRNWGLDGGVAQSGKVCLKNGSSYNVFVCQQREIAAQGKNSRNRVLREV